MRIPRGFTLVELLVVFGLIALLLSLAMPRFMGSTDSAKEKVRTQNLATLRDSIDKFRADQGRYPAQLAELVSKGYLRALPLDPVTGSAEWGPLQAPDGAEPGIHDVAPPK
jgi:general secretion pathway protein G